MNVSVIGGGSWGSSFCRYLGSRGIPSRLWIREQDIYERLLETRENKVFLPGFIFPPTVTFSRDIRETVQYGHLLFIAVPSQFCRPIYEEVALSLPKKSIVVSLTKGIESKTLMRMSQVMEDVFPSENRANIAVLSGPSFAREVASDHPTALVVASRSVDVAREIQKLISSLTVRAYTSSDVIGVEVAGALKNVIAIASGIIDGLNFGLNSRAALITRGLVEMTKLGVSMGARKETFSGLAGLGDLILTCTGTLSRNHTVGNELAKGKSLQEILSATKMVPEGVHTTLMASELARSQGIEMPICEQVYQVLYKDKPPREAIIDLMSRSLRHE